MDSLSSSESGSFAKKAATASVCAPGIVLAIRLFVQPHLHGNPIGILVDATALMLVAFGGLILGIIGLAGMARHGTSGILVRGLVGTVVNGFLAFVILLVVPRAMANQWQVLTASAPGTNHYDKDGVQFSNNNQLATTSTTTAPAATVAEGNFIPAMDRVDMVHDQKRNILYITSGDSVLRYQLATKNFLSPLTLGGDLRGIDISPNGDQLAVADAAGGNGRVSIHVVDLKTGSDMPASFTAEMQESGTYSVAYGADGQIWISSSMSGSGWLPLRKYNPPTHSAMKLLPDVSQDTMLAASADRQSIGFAEGQMTPGTYGRILYRASQLPPKPMRSDGFLYEIAISRDGSQLAVPEYNRTILEGSQVPALKEPQIIGAAYHPQRNYLFVSQASTSLISVYDTSNYSKVKELDFGDQFEWAGHAFDSGRLKMSQDGFYLFCTVHGGIRYMATGL